MKHEFLQSGFDLVVGDCETLSRWSDSVILSAAFVGGDIRKKTSFKELCETALFMKFEATEQRALGRKAERITLDWWGSPKVCEEARIQSLYADPARDISIREFSERFTSWLRVERLIEPKTAYMMDRNLFDFSKLQHMVEVTLGGDQPWDYHNVMDVTSYLRAWGLGRYGTVDKNSIEGFVYHDPIHDSALDWLRIQDGAVKLGIIELV